MRITISKEDRQHAKEARKPMFRFEIDWSYCINRPQRLKYTGKAGAISVEDATLLFEKLKEWDSLRSKE